MRAKTRLALAFQKEADRRMTMGLATYGDFDPATDKRNLSQEAADECVDVMNYMRMFEQKYEGKKKDAAVIKKQAFTTWCLLQSMMEEEATLAKGGAA